MIDRAALEAELRRLPAECDAPGRLADARAVEQGTPDRLKDEIIATTSHDLKSPLTAILGHAQLMLRLFGAAEPDLGRVARGAAVIRDRPVAMARLLDDLLVASRLQAAVFVPRPTACEIGECLTTARQRPAGHRVGPVHLCGYNCRPRGAIVGRIAGRRPGRYLSVYLAGPAGNRQDAPATRRGVEIDGAGR